MVSLYIKSIFVYQNDIIMGINKPYHRNYRAFIESDNSGFSSWAYICDHEYAISPEYYTRSFLIIQKDIQNLFEYIEPSDINLKTYSYRIHELYMRVCIEVEANFKAIFKENIYSKDEKKWNINDYKKINKTHHLDAYKAIFPIWDGVHNEFSPFKVWETNGILSWYRDYNLCKHDRHTQKYLANLENLLNAFTALFILLTSQFNRESFSPGTTLISCRTGAEYYPDEFGIGDYLIVKFPENWGDNEKYDFNWSTLQNEQNKFQKIDYNIL